MAAVPTVSSGRPYPRCLYLMRWQVQLLVVETRGGDAQSKKLISELTVW